MSKVVGRKVKTVKRAGCFRKGKVVTVYRVFEQAILGNRPDFPLCVTDGDGVTEAVALGEVRYLNNRKVVI